MAWTIVNKSVHSNWTAVVVVSEHVPAVLFLFPVPVLFPELVLWPSIGRRPPVFEPPPHVSCVQVPVARLFGSQHPYDDERLPLLFYVDGPHIRFGVASFEVQFRLLA